MNAIDAFIEELLLESADVSQVIDAIKKRYEVKINYKKPGDDEEGTGERIIQPVAYGTSKKGTPLLRAFQPFGDTKTKVPRWKLFNINNIEEWKPLKRNKFSEPPGQFYSDGIGAFNPYGDKTIGNVMAIADFEGAKTRYERGGLKKYNEKRRAAKVEQDPLYILKKNMEKSKKVGNIDYIKRNADSWQKQLDTAKKTKEISNQSSIEDMEYTGNILDPSTSTVGPTYKSDNEGREEVNQINNNDYTQAKENGPVLKGDFYWNDDKLWQDNEEEYNPDNDEDYAEWLASRENEYEVEDVDEEES